MSTSMSMSMSMSMSISISSHLRLFLLAHKGELGSAFIFLSTGRKFSFYCLSMPCFSVTLRQPPSVFDLHAHLKLTYTSPKFGHFHSSFRWSYATSPHSHTHTHRYTHNYKCELGAVMVCHCAVTVDLGHLVMQLAHGI